MRSTRSIWSSQRSTGSAKNASTTGLFSASWHTFSTSGPRTSHARSETLASPSSSDSASGAANGGSSPPSSTPREPGPSVWNEL